jgi:hypothetical protein
MLSCVVMGEGNKLVGLLPIGVTVGAGENGRLQAEVIMTPNKRMKATQAPCFGLAISISSRS